MPLRPQRPLQQSEWVLHLPPAARQLPEQTKPTSVGAQIWLQHSSGEVQPEPLPRQLVTLHAPPSHCPEHRLIPTVVSRQ
jgi:hypothetical protein